MNIDLSINRMAFREADGLGFAQSLVAKKRQDLELRLLRAKIVEGQDANGANIEAALRDMKEQSDALLRATSPRGEESDHKVDKTA